MIRESAYAKVNLVLHVGEVQENGLHELSSLLASIDLADEVSLREAAEDSVACEGVEGDNLAARALEVFRRWAPHAELPPQAVVIDKRIPVAAGLGGGSADAAAVLRAANELTGRPLGTSRLRRLATRLGSDVPSQVEPRHALVAGTGDVVVPVELPRLALVLVPSQRGLSTAEVFAELDRLGGARDELDAEAMRALAEAPLEQLAARMENDLQRAALSLRPDLEQTIERLRAAGALAAQVSGSGPTVFGVFADMAAAEGAAAELPEAIAVVTRS